MQKESIDLRSESMEPVRAEDIVVAEALAPLMGSLAPNNVGGVAKELLGSLQRIQKTGRPVTGEILCATDPMEAIKRILIHVLAHLSWERAEFRTQAEADQAVKKVSPEEVATRTRAAVEEAAAKRLVDGSELTEEAPEGGNGDDRKGGKEKKENRAGGIFTATVMQVVERGKAVLARNEVSGGKTVVVYFPEGTGLKRGDSITLVLDKKNRKDEHDHPIATVYVPPKKDEPKKPEKRI